MNGRGAKIAPHPGQSRVNEGHPTSMSLTLFDPMLTYRVKLEFWGFLEVLMPEYVVIFSDRHSFKVFLPFLAINQGLSLNLPSGDFYDEGDVVPFLGCYTSQILMIKMPKQ